MYFNAHLTVTINGNTIKTICSVSKKHDGHSLGSECDITLPMNCVIQYKDGTHDKLTQYTVNTQAAFGVGSTVLVTANYDTYNEQTIFEGFITDFVFGNPIKIKCMDYQYFFNLGIFGQERGASVKINKKKKSPVINTYGCHYASITLKDLLTNIIGFVNDTIDIKSTDAEHVTLVLPIPDIELVNITFSMMTPASICQYFIKELGLVLTLNGTNLYCNVASNTTDVINYATNRNVIVSDLQKPTSTFQTYKVKAWFYQPTGKKDSIEVGDTNGQQRDVYFYRVKQDAALYLKMATEALNKVRQMRFNGSITTYLYPEPILFAKAVYTDIRYPARSGNYVITAIETTINQSGYRHKLKLAYLTDLNDTTNL